MSMTYTCNYEICQKYYQVHIALHELTFSTGFSKIFNLSRPTFWASFILTCTSLVSAYCSAKFWRDEFKSVHWTQSFAFPELMVLDANVLLNLVARLQVSHSLFIPNKCCMWNNDIFYFDIKLAAQR